MTHEIDLQIQQMQDRFHRERARMEHGIAELNAGRPSIWEAFALFDERATCERLARLGDPEPLKRWYEMRDDYARRCAEWDSQRKLTTETPEAD
jgi:hypothetical protein